MFSDKWKFSVRASNISLLQSFPIYVHHPVNFTYIDRMCNSLFFVRNGNERRFPPNISTLVPISLLIIPRKISKR